MKIKVVGNGRVWDGRWIEKCVSIFSAGLWPTMFHSLEMVSKYLGQWPADEEPTLKCDYACV